MFDKSKVQEQLDSVQKGCKARCLSIDQAINIIGEAESWIIEHQLPSDVLPYVTYEYTESVPKAYKYSADSTRLALSFTKKGKVKDVTITRTYAPVGYHKSRFCMNAGKLFTEIYNLDFYSVDEKQRKLFMSIVRCWGFNAGSLTAQV